MRRRRHSRVVIASSLAAAIVSAGCGGSPCAELAARVCADTDARTCALYRDGLGGERPSTSQSEACATVLADPTSLSALLKNLAKRSGR